MIKAPIFYQLLANWFTKSFLPPIARDVAICGAITEEKYISHSQYLELVYSQVGTQNELILHALCPTSDTSIPSTEPPVDGVLGSIQTQMVTKCSKRKNQPTVSANQSVSNPKTVSPHVI